MEREVCIVNRLGLHARAAARLVDLANGFSSRIHLIRDGDAVDAKSILGILTLAVPFGSTILVTAEGNDAEAAADAIVRLIEDRFGEER